MRGTLVYLSTRFAFPGIIPAYAGNTSAARCPLTCSWDHPRVCGEHPFRLDVDSPATGSSPRMRGTLGIPHVLRDAAGIIPAYAGNTVLLFVDIQLYGDHPRVCGEHAESHESSARIPGSSPRMRGTLFRAGHEDQAGGIIPAYAGNTRQASAASPRSRDHPRVCGEHEPNTRDSSLVIGSSPRMRGTHGKYQLEHYVPGIIPAYAGNTLRDYSNFVVSKFMSFVFHLV